MQIFFLFLLTMLIWVSGIFITNAYTDVRQKTVKNGEVSSTSSINRGMSTRVLWTVAGYKITKDAAWGKADARTLLFKPLDMDENSIKFDGRTCRDVAFKKKVVNTGEYLEQAYGVTPEELGIEDSELEIIQTNCELEGFKEYMRIKDSRLVIHIRGVFFYFAPAVTY